MIHKELLRLRRERRLRQVDVARKIGVSPDTYRRWEWGKFQPRADQLIRLASVFQVTEIELLRGVEDEKRGVDTEGTGTA